MKKMVPIGFVSLFSAGLMATMSISSLRNDIKTDEQNSGEFKFSNLQLVKDNSTNPDIDKQIQDILNTVTQKTYLGDLNEATNNGDLKSIDVSKLINLDDTNGKVMPAYLKVSGDYTSNIDEAKRSHIQNPVVKYHDNKGNIYDSESEATKAMASDEENYSNGIAYYEISDMSGSQQVTYNINPLNINDTNKLKEIAYSNASISGSRFDVVRLKADNNNYNRSDYKGTSDYEINNKVTSLLDEITKIVFDNSFFTITNSYVHYEWFFGMGFMPVLTHTTRDYYGVTDSSLDNLYKESEKDLKNYSSTSKFDNFQISVSQQNFSWYDIAKKSQEAYDMAYQKAKSYFNNDSSKDEMSKKIAEVVKTVVGTNFLGSSKISTDKRTNYNDVKTLIKAKVSGALNEEFKKAFSKNVPGYADARGYLTSGFKDILQENYVKNGDNVKYAITYNGSPLYLIDNSIINIIKDQEAFRVDPVNGIKRHLEWSSKYEQNWRDISKRTLKNISNTYSYDGNKNLSLTKDNLLTNYSTDKKFSNFTFNNSQTENPFNKAKLINEDLYSKNNVNKNDLEKVLNRRESDDKSLLNNQYGTIEAIYQYNKTLSKLMNLKNVPQALIKNVNESAIGDTNDVVFLYSENKTPATIKFGKYANYGTKFNVSLTDQKNKIISSTEALNTEFYLENLGIPTKVYNFYDYNGKLITSEIIESVNGDFSQSEKNAWENAMKKIDVQSSSNYVYYLENEQDKNPKLVKNNINKLYVCFISNNNASTLSEFSSFELKASNNGTYYGFTSYDDLKTFVTNYVNTINGIGPIIPPVPPTINTSRSFYKDVLIGAWSSLGIIIVLAGFSSLYFYNISNSKLKNDRRTKQKYNSLKYTSTLNLNR